MATDLAIVSKTDGTGSSLPINPDSSSSGTVRTQLAASAALTPPVNPVPTQEQDEKAKRQVNQVPKPLVDGTEIQSTTPSLDTESLYQAITAMIPDEDDVEEVFFDPDSLMQESEHAQDIVETLTPFLKESWDEKHGEGSWESTLLTAYMSAEVNYSVMEDASISANSEDLAWIAVSKLAAQAAGLSPEYCCPQFPWENTTEESMQNTEQLNRWQELKTYLLSGAALEEVQSVKDSEEGSQTQLQPGLSYLQNGLSLLATAATSDKLWRFVFWGTVICSLSFVAAAATPLVANACINGSAANVTSTASAMVPYVASAGSALAVDLVNAATNTVATLASTASCVVTAPTIVNLLADGVAAAHNSNPPPPIRSLSDAPQTIVQNTATNASWFDIFSYTSAVLYSMSKFRNALIAASKENYGRAAGNLALSVIPPTIAYFGSPTAWVLTATGLSAAESLLPLLLPRPVDTTTVPPVDTASAPPVDTASAPPAKFQLYARENVVCKKGIFNIKVPGPVGLSPEQKEDLIKAFISEVLDQNPVKTMVGDKIEFQFPESKKWTVQVTPRDGHSHSAGRKLEGEKTYSESPSHRNSIKKLETLRKVMVGGAHAFAVMQALRSITMDKIPNNAPAVSPVIFTNAPPALCSPMQAMLAIPEIQTAMKQSNHPEVKKIANAYTAKLVPGTASDPLDLAALEAELNKIISNSRPRDDQEYRNALFNLMKNRGDDLSKVLVPQLDIPYPTLTQNTVAANWLQARNTPLFPKLKISPSDTEENLQALVDAQQSQGSMEKQFHSIPNFLQISVDKVAVDATGTTTTRAAKLNNEKLELELDWKYIEANTHPHPLRTNANKPKYSLQNMILHTAQGSDITYQRTVENVNGELQIFYWKFDPANGIQAHICIDIDEFKEAANSPAKKDLFFLKQEEGAVRKEEILAQRYDSDSNPDLEENNNVFFKYDNNTVYNMSLLSLAAIVQAVQENNSKYLQYFVHQALRIAHSRGDTKITLPVPVGKAADGMNWPIGIMWFAAQEFMKTLPAGSNFTVHLAIDKSKKQGERRAHLVKQIDMAETIYLQHQWQGASPEPPARAETRFRNFTNDWKAYSILTRRHGFLY